MAEAVISFAVERLRDLLISEATFLSGVRDKILEIERQLKQMQNFIKDADNKRGNPAVAKWVAEIRDLALLTEDILEEYAVKVASSREGRHIKNIIRRFACIMCECITLHKIGAEIGTIQNKITNLATSRPTLGIQELHDYRVGSSKAEEEIQQQVRISYPHLIDKDFVGMKEEIKELVLHLKNKDRGREVVSVWGMGGQGKTTLVRKLYNHTDVRSYFQAFAWVCITQKLDRQKVLQDILQGLLPSKKDEIKGMGDAELVQQLYKTQKELQCLVVIDDIWSVDHWETLKAAFPVDETTCSKILLTTRNEAVANIGFPYELRSLNEEEGWKLLLKKAFPQTDDTTEIRVEPKKEKLGRDMVQQCQGLPLAISSLGGLLKNKKSSREWEMVNKDIASNLSREGSKYGGVKHILGLSYDDLPFRLKQLFLYLGTFKEDEEIKAGQLYLLWIAEGMIPSFQKAKGEMLIDVAERYLVELAQRSLVQLKSTDERTFYDGRAPEFPWMKIYSCSLHDLIRDICLSKGEEEKFLKVVIDFRDARNESYYHLVIGTEERRLAIHMNDDAKHLTFDLEQQHMVGQLRSLLFFDARSREFYSSLNKINNLEYFKLVRVLKLDGLKFTKRELSRVITELIHLRYLSLNGCKLEEWPSGIEDLRYLETLDLRVICSYLIIPNVLWKMKRLKHLYLPENFGIVDKKLRFDGLNELELLRNFDASNCDPNDLMKLTNLQVLSAFTRSLQENEGVINFVNSDLHHPRYTSLFVEHGYDLIKLLQCDNLNVLCIEGVHRGNIIPQPYEHQHLSQSLTRISLYHCYFEADSMELLKRLPNLQELKLDINSFVGKEFVCSANSFPQLLCLCLFSLGSLEKWRMDEGAMPNLRDLSIFRCERLDMLPNGLKFLASLRGLTIWEMPKAFSNRVRVIDGVEGQDFHKVRHIPSILII